MKKLALLTILISSLIVLAGCGAPQTQPPLAPPPPTTPVTPGYIRSYDHKISFGFDYPESWEMEALPTANPGGISMDKIEVYTKKGEPTRIVIVVGSTNFKSLAEVKGFGRIDQQSILKEGFVKINDRQAYEVVFKQYPDKKAKWVTFLANDREYRIECYTTEVFYPEREEIFDYVISSFVID